VIPLFCHSGLDPESSVFGMVPGFRRDGVWTPAFAGVTALATFYESIKFFGIYFSDSKPPGRLFFY